jgi:carboxyl-terminal processing protease
METGRPMQPLDPANPPSADWPATTPAPVRVAPVQRTSPILAVAVAMVTLLAGGALFMSGFLLGGRAATQPGTPAADADAFQPFWDTYRAIDTRYAGGDVDQQALIRGAIRGMVEALEDPYSTYLTPEEYQSGLQDLSGQFEGIGAEIGTKDTTSGTTGECSTLGPDCVLVIVSPIEGSPAEKADLRPGDEVLAVDGSGLEGLTVDGARDRVRGKKGTEVVLTIRRDGGEPFDIAVVRDTIVQREVIHEDLAGGSIGYIRVSGFSDNAAEQYHEALESDIEAGRTMLILDLRGNPGGYVTAARRIASEFISSGPIFWEETANGAQSETSAQSGGLATGDEFELVVLVDRGSASASEIVAGALKDRGRATIVGETTFGKGTVQQWIELPDTGALKLTIAKWLTPDKHWIHGTGVEPDVVVELPDEVPAGEDPARDRAIEILSGTGAADLDRAA